MLPQMHPPPQLHQMGRRPLADGACGYSRGHLPAGISRCMHVVQLLGVLFVVSHARHWHPSSCDSIGLCMPHFICSHINLLLWCV
ncbi:hypothetical protein BDA96_02G211700 [Sorghum bicolor]|uniref:Uncharacterized protein n=2 Tax=Sorghum bicolor TaxID=4558 RepID=A0A921UTK9_SORBI|nr:hypothetical protein BDA96_02G211700 [Sorghum bicolor]KXG35631.1 hypothetical protein SORBI_3002G201200 [Sorghum bicolor]